MHRHPAPAIALAALALTVAAGISRAGTIGVPTDQPTIQLGIIEAAPIATRSGQVILYKLTELGRSVCTKMDIAPEPRSRESLEHRYWVKRIAEYFGKKGYEVTCEHPIRGNGAVDLGIATTVPVPTNPGFAGGDLDPRLTARTTLDSLNAGVGIDLSDGLRIRVGQSEALIDFAETETIEDVLGRINQSGIGVLARIAEDGRTIEVLNRVSGAALTIEENGGSAADALGIRSMHRGVPLAWIPSMSS